MKKLSIDIFGLLHYANNANLLSCCTAPLYITLSVLTVTLFH